MLDISGNEEGIVDAHLDLIEDNVIRVRKVLGVNLGAVSIQTEIFESANDCVDL